MKTKKRKYCFAYSTLLVALFLLCGTEMFGQLPAIREQRKLPLQDKSVNQSESFYYSKAKLKENSDLYFGRKDYLKVMESSEDIDSIIEAFSVDTSLVKKDLEFTRRLQLFNNAFTFFEDSDSVLINPEVDDEFIQALLEEVKTPIDTISNFYYNYYNRQVQRLTSEINLLEEDANGKNLEELIALEKQIIRKKESLDDYNGAIEKIENNFKDPKVLLPTFKGEEEKEHAFNRIYSKRYDKSIYLGNSAALQINGTGAIIEAELLSAFMSGLRVSFGSLITNSDVDESENGEDNTEITTSNTEAFQRLLAGGGNLYLGVELPLLFYQDKRFSFYTNTTGRLNLEVSEFSNEVDSSTGNGNIRMNFYTSISTDNREFTFFGLFQYGLYFGSDAFYENLLLDDKKEFAFGELTAGFTINNSIRVALIFNTFSSEENLRSGRVTIGTQILSGLFD
ncbi:hypothetical protein J4E06_12240 [Muricauda sp. NFXS6]|uniref:hypothetical protein n=1 Tax=Allomuricauda sp. NFXS6 TaxID=2819094 RepID=UPI0032E0060B